MQQNDAEIINMYFNYAEAPIKEWLAEFLNKSVEEVFPDYVDKTDLIGFEIGTVDEKCNKNKYLCDQVFIF